MEPAAYPLVDVDNRDSRPPALPHVRATTAAEEALARATHDHGPVLLVLSPTGHGGSLPMCLPASGLTIGPSDVLLGTIASCPVYLARRQLASWPHREVLLDVEPGLPDGISLPAGDGRQFVAWLSSASLVGDVRT